LNSRGDQCPGAVLFCLPDEEDKAWVKIAGNSGAVRELRPATAQLLFEVLRRRPSGVLRGVSGDTLRKHRERARGDLSDLTGRPVTDFADHGFSLPKDLLVFGAACRPRL
jgi:hypothetical protein